MRLLISGNTTKKCTVSNIKIDDCNNSISISVDADAFGIMKHLSALNYHLVKISTVKEWHKLHKKTDTFVNTTHGMYESWIDQMQSVGKTRQ